MSRLLVSTLFHGSALDLEQLEPGSDGNVWATHERGWAIPFALPLIVQPGVRGGWGMARSGTIAMMRLDRCTLDMNGVGYVYELDTTAFEPLDDWQWVARTAVTPRGRTVVRAADYVGWIAS